MIVRVLLLLLLASPAAALENQLRSHPSPYLAMHGEDPVAWQAWGEAAVEQARAEGKLLFLSSGYFSCHWCHVMQRESYRDPEIAALLNTRFVPVKIDRELQGALDAYLIDFVERTQGHAGWPLNVFLTPEGYPLIGATYLPPARFLALLQRLDSTWLDERGRLRRLARRTSLALREQDQTPPVVEPLPDAQLIIDLRDQALALGDPLEGGFGEQNKFPMAPQLLALLEIQQRLADPALARFLVTTLDHMASEGLRDHLGGGFFRYTVDPSWQVPHFEKMLYTQAQLAEVYLVAADKLQRPDYLAIARDTLDFVLSEMHAPDGGYYASFSAVDDRGEEGAVYLWSVDQLHALLGEDDTALARRHWRMLDLPAFDGGHLPRQGETAAEIAAALEQPTLLISTRLADIRAHLLAARRLRGLPVDEKRLAGWNGLLLAALSRAAVRLGDPRYARAAHQLRDFLRERLWDGKVLQRALAAGQTIGEASLDDYAQVAYGFAAHAELSGEPADRTFVAVMLNVAWQRYLDHAGWRLDDRSLLPGLPAQPAIAEGALPAAPGVLMQVAFGSDDPDMVTRAAAAAELGRAAAQAEPFWYVGQVGALLRFGVAQQPASSNTVE